MRIFITFISISKAYILFFSSPNVSHFKIIVKIYQHCNYFMQGAHGSWVKSFKEISHMLSIFKAPAYSWKDRMHTYINTHK